MENNYHYHVSKTERGYGGYSCTMGRMVPPRQLCNDHPTFLSIYIVYNLRNCYILGTTIFKKIRYSGKLITNNNFKL